MRKSELIKQLQDEVDKYGDTHIKKVRVDELDGWWQRAMTSPKRKNKATGMKAEMNLTEFKKYCDENPIEVKS